MNTQPDIVLIGHPFLSNGRGEDLRSTYIALRSIGLRPKVFDIYEQCPPDSSLLHTYIRNDLCQEAGKINIFHINGDEVTGAKNQLAHLDFSASYNIVFPAWELEIYPDEWAAQLDQFDEIWVPSVFVQNALSKVVKKPILLLSDASEVILDTLYSRSYFGIPESDYTFLFSFDFGSYIQRKNPGAVLESFKQLLHQLPGAPIKLVIKMHGAKEKNGSHIHLLTQLQQLAPHVIVINETLTENEVRNLIRICDCYISLHRSEGFGRGLSEAMSCGKPVIATNYSGNIDFMSADDSLLVDYTLIPVKEGEYPHWENQYWADADIQQAIFYMKKLVENPAWGYEIGRKAAISIRKNTGFRVCGLAYAKRIESHINFSEISRVLKTIRKSRSWRSVMLLREAKKWLFTPKQQITCYAIKSLRVLKKAYKVLPLSQKTKYLHRRILSRFFPRLLRLSGAQPVPARVLQTIKQSRSWRWTLPFREAQKWLFAPKQQITCYARKSLWILKKAYKALPLRQETKYFHQRILSQFFPRLTRLSGTQPIPTSSSAPSLYSKEYTVITKRYPQGSVVTMSLPTSSEPIVSIIIPVYGKIDYTMNCLDSIVKNPPRISFEIIIVDDHSPDHSVEILNQVKGIRLIQHQKNQGFIRSCNKGAAAALGEHLCFLNNDTRVEPEWLDALVKTFTEFPGTGFIGSKLIYPDGRLQEAGGIIWRDGSVLNVGRLHNDPMDPIYNYAREVDYCSGASIVVPALLFKEIGGFDEHYLPAYCEDADLALKIREKGYRVIYQPLSTVIHYEGITSGIDITQGTKAYQVENTKKLYQRWKNHLKVHEENGTNVDQEKDRMAKYRVLVLDLYTPTPDEDSGSVDAFNILLLFREMHFQVTFIPEDNLYLPKYTAQLQSMGIEMLYGPYCTSVQSHLALHGNRYDVIFLLRPGIMYNYVKQVRQYCPQAKVIYHTVDLHFLRMQREAELLNNKNKMRLADDMKELELRLMTLADITTVVSLKEKDLLENLLPQKIIKLLPGARQIKGIKIPYADRQDIIFVGGYQHAPNIDAVMFFVKDVMPLLRDQLPGIHFYIAGSNPSPEVHALAASDVIVMGFVEDLNPLLEKMRISVAPLRFGAGIKGKIQSAMTVGLPVVATSLAAEGMMLSNRENILIADDAKAFASAIVEIYQNEVLWKKLSEAGLAFAHHTWSPEVGWVRLADILAHINILVECDGRELTLYETT